MVVGSPKGPGRSAVVGGPIHTRWQHSKPFPENCGPCIRFHRRLDDGTTLFELQPVAQQRHAIGPAGE